MGRSSEFDAAQVGPEAAKAMATPPNIWSDEYNQPNPTPRLFPLSDVALPEPHQQTRAQFAADSRTWWHGRYGEALPRTGGARNAGIHVGTFGASDKRRRDLGPSHKYPGSYDEGPQPWRSFPVRLVGETHPNWEGPGSTPSNPGHDEGARWRPKSGIHFYKNAVEDAGSISALAPNKQFLLTHGQAVRAAGKAAHPLIQWEAKQFGRKEYDIGKEDPHVVASRNQEFNWSRLTAPRLFQGMGEQDLDTMQHRRNLLHAAGLGKHPNYASAVVGGWNGPQGPGI